MTESIESIEMSLLEAHEAGNAIDIVDWVTRFPQYRDHLLELWIWLEGLERQSDAACELEVAADEVTHDVLRDACLAVSLGDASLVAPVRVDPDAERHLGESMAAIRAVPYKVSGTAQLPFRRAAVYAWIAQRLSHRRPRVTRLAVQKCAYLLESGLHCEVFTGHKQKALGPYDPRAKYSDAEPIAIKRNWMLVDGAELKPGPAAEEASKYAPRYLRSAEVAGSLVDCLAALSDDELELWATVVWLERGVTARERAPTPAEIRATLAASPAWSAKLTKKHFSVSSIEAALPRLVELRLIGRPQPQG